MLRIILITSLYFTAACADEAFQNCAELHEPELIEQAWQGIRPYFEELSGVEYEEGRRRLEANMENQLLHCSKAKLFVHTPRSGVAGSKLKFLLDPETFELVKLEIFNRWFDWPPDFSKFQ